MSACTTADAGREQRIKECRERMLAAADAAERREWWTLMRGHLKARSTVQVMHMERERGLR